MLKRMFFVSLVALVVMSASAAMAAIPPYISFQGRLTDTSVSPAVTVTSEVDVWFGIFDVDTAGTEIWAGTKKITPDSDGIFNVILGYDITPTIGDLSNLAFDKQYWVEVRVGTATTGTRQMLTSVPYAFTSKNLKGGWVDAIGDPAVSGTASPVTAIGVYGFSNQGSGVYGSSGTNIGVQGYSSSGTAVLGNASGTGMTAAISGKNSATSKGAPGVRGESKTGSGVHGINTTTNPELVTIIADGDPIPAGVKGTSNITYGVYGTSSGISDNAAGVYGENGASGVGVKGSSASGWAGYFEGGNGLYCDEQVKAVGGILAGTTLDPVGYTYGGLFYAPPFGRPLGVYGNIYLTGSVYPGEGTLDIAEWIKVSDASISSGDVVAIDKNNIKHVVKASSAYNTLVAGIISTNPGYLAGNLVENGDILDKEEIEKRGYRMLALAGQVPCNVSAENGPIEIGDLLTSSNTPGYAMKATEPKVGTILGKALEPLAAGKGKITVLVTLQ